MVLVEMSVKGETLVLREHQGRKEQTDYRVIQVNKVNLGKKAVQGRMVFLD